MFNIRLCIFKVSAADLAGYIMKYDNVSQPFHPYSQTLYRKTKEMELKENEAYGSVTVSSFF